MTSSAESAIRIDIPGRPRACDILVESGLLARWADEIRARAPASGYLVVIDERVAALRPEFAAAGLGPLIPVPAGESGKTLSSYAGLCERLLAFAPDRRTVLAAVGGGVTGDLAGFAAATLLRGLAWVQTPTTLLAQVDSSVGGKTGVNAGGGKNLVGAFHQPSLVLADPGALSTLPRREWLAGYAEVVKYALLGDAAFFEDLDADPPTRESDPARLACVVRRCCRIKAGIVASDERESGRRALLNYGHTFGHALEALAGYDGCVTHGEAVAVGMLLAADFAVARGLCPAGAPARMRGHWARAGLPGSIGELGCGGQGGRGPDWRALLSGPELEQALSRDKKAAAASLALILPSALGRCEIRRGFAPAEAADFMRAAL